MTTLPADLSHPCYHDGNAARATFESIRWPDGPFCPQCGAFDTVSPHVGPKQSMGPGWFWCSACRRHFTVRVRNVLERSHIPLHKWLIGFRLYASSKKGFSAHQLNRTLGVTYKTAWFMAHRIRECMDMDAAGPIGGEGKTLEADETFVNKQRGRGRWVFQNERGWVRVTDHRSLAAFALVELGGQARAMPLDNASANQLRGALKKIRGHALSADDGRVARLRSPRPRVRQP